MIDPVYAENIALLDRVSHALTGYMQSLENCNPAAMSDEEAAAVADALCDSRRRWACCLASMARAERKLRNG
jgi:hypothetical protein